MRKGIASVWYFTSKDGYILKKDAKNVKMGKIHKAFQKKAEYAGQTMDDVPCATLYQYSEQINSVTKEERMALKIGYVSNHDLFPVMRAYEFASQSQKQILDEAPSVL